MVGEGFGGVGREHELQQRDDNDQGNGGCIEEIEKRRSKLRGWANQLCIICKNLRGIGKSNKVKISGPLLDQCFLIYSGLDFLIAISDNGLLVPCSLHVFLFRFGHFFGLSLPFNSGLPYLGSGPTVCYLVQRFCNIQVQVIRCKSVKTKDHQWGDADAEGEGENNCF